MNKNSFSYENNESYKEKEYILSIIQLIMVASITCPND